MDRRSIKLKIEPSVLKYARFCSGYSLSEAAKKAGLKEEKLASLENEKSEISIAQLEKLTGIYKMPLAYFFLQKIPKDVILPQDFRIIYSSERENSFSPPVMLAIRRARYIQSIVQELNEDNLGYDFQNVSITDDVEKTASYFRSVLNVSVTNQGRWSEPFVALRNWKGAVEKLNIFVLQQSIPKEDGVSAFSLADQTPYIIVLNSSEHESRRVFSLFHEIGHILLHRSGVCTPDNFSRNSFEYIRIEKFCNQFAASLLVPREEFIQDPIVQKIRNIPFDTWSVEDIKIISSKFRVSQEVIYRRLMTIGILNEAKYEQERAKLIRGFEEYRDRKKGKKLIIPQHTKIISKNGRAYSSFVLDNLHSNRITLSDAANYLDTNSRHISKVESHL